MAAERIWRTGTPGRHRRPARLRKLRRLLGWALTVGLLAASGVILYQRFHHAPFHVTGVAILRQTPHGCGVDVTGRIDTNGSAGTVSYQWAFRPDTHPPQPLSQSVSAGQHAIDVTVAVEGEGQGTAERMVALQVLGPDPMSAPTTVVLHC
jgi:hypothetical protein